MGLERLNADVWLVPEGHIPVHFYIHEKQTIPTLFLPEILC